MQGGPSLEATQQSATLLLQIDKRPGFGTLARREKASEKTLIHSIEKVLYMLIFQ
jgi:hypothetical protein